MEMDWEALARQASRLSAEVSGAEECAPAPRPWSDAERKACSALVLAGLRQEDLEALDRARALFGGLPLTAPKDEEPRQLLWEAAAHPLAFGFAPLARMMREQAELEDGSDNVEALGPWLRGGMPWSGEPKNSRPNSSSRKDCLPIVACFDQDNAQALGALLSEPRWLRAVALEEPKPWSADRPERPKAPLRECLAWQAVERGAPRCAALICALAPFQAALDPQAFEAEALRWPAEATAELRAAAPRIAGLFEKVVSMSTNAVGEPKKMWRDLEWALLKLASERSVAAFGPGCPVGWADLLMSSRNLSASLRRHHWMIDALSKMQNTTLHPGPVEKNNPWTPNVQELALRCAQLGVAPDWSFWAKHYDFEPTLSQWFDLQGASGPAGHLVKTGPRL
jgi:hypothetical protein